MKSDDTAVVFELTYMDPLCFDRIEWHIPEPRIVWNHYADIIMYTEQDFVTPLRNKVLGKFTIYTMWVFIEYIL